jgi:hypothetical protein
MASRFIAALGLTATLAVSAVPAQAKEVAGYGFAAAAQEITQLFWLAEVASVCGWTAREDASKFKSFAVRFISAHLSEPNQLALLSLVSEDRYANQLHVAALEGAHENCASPRWQMGWLGYKAAADEHEALF